MRTVGAIAGCARSAVRVTEQQFSYRDKQLLTALSAVAVKRAYYHCEQCQEGVIPKDHKLDIVDTSFSPGVRRMMGQVGGKGPRRGTPRLRRFGRCVGQNQSRRAGFTSHWQTNRYSFSSRGELALSGKVVPFKAVPKITSPSMGRGYRWLRVRPKDARERIKPQGQDSEVKLGCVFTQTELDDHQRPVRDEHGTTYVGAIESAEAFGSGSMQRHRRA